MHTDLIAKIAPTANMSGEQIVSVVITGLVVVFLVLVLLVWFVQGFGKTFTNNKNKTNTTTKNVTPPVKTSSNLISGSLPQNFDDSNDNDEIVAVISAVIANMSAQDGKNYQITSVKPHINPLRKSRSAWAAEGLRQNTNPF
ncbi:MAG: OadG family protein [Ruminococcus sp.]|jgi:sodium pump decarboxylase gamma subunit|nr:OadG family protein [Ruminococcus sp.]